MLKIRNVLVPTDYSGISRRAFDHARFAAEHFGAVLHVLHVLDADVQTGSASAAEVDPFEGDRSIIAAVEYAGEPVDDEVELDFIGPASHRSDSDSSKDDGVLFVQRTAQSVREGILEYADEVDADLIVMATRGRSGPRRLFMGSRTEEVVHRAHCPVLTVRSGSQTVPGRGVSRILVPIDFSSVSESQILHAKELAETYGAELDVLHVVEEPNAALYYSTGEVSATLPSIVNRAREALAELVGRGRQDVPVRIHVLVGHPAIDILDFAEEHGSDLIVIATHAQKGRHMLLGSVAEQVIRRAPLLVATMKESGKSLLADDAEAQPPAYGTRTSSPDALKAPASMR